jgi:CO/xanthine dehydrogenase Mo-binding subunit
MHGSMGSSCAMAEVKDGKLTSWSASQATHNLLKQLAQMLGMPLDSVRCIDIEGSGCYGRNGHEDAAADAALLAKLTGKPVRVPRSRADLALATFPVLGCPQGSDGCIDILFAPRPSSVFAA